MKHLYELTEEMERLLDEEGEEAEQALMVVCRDIEKKSENICKFISVLDSDAAAFKAEEERLAARRKAIENKADRIRQYIKEQMIQHGIDKIDAGIFKINLYKSKPVVEVKDADALPGQYKIIIPATERIDKNAIFADLKAGEDVPGAELQDNFCLRIR